VQMNRPCCALTAIERKKVERQRCQAYLGIRLRTTQHNAACVETIGLMSDEAAKLDRHLSASNERCVGITKKKTSASIRPHAEYPRDTPSRLEI
jgi:hypothetical protein